jgi:hypothetical protein
MSKKILFALMLISFIFSGSNAFANTKGSHKMPDGSYSPHKYTSREPTVDSNGHHKYKYTYGNNYGSTNNSKGNGSYSNPKQYRNY